MKSLLKILKYLFFFFILSFISDRALDQLFIKVSKRSFMPIRNANFDILILGNSRANHNIIPKDLDSLLNKKSINLGRAYSNPLEILHTLKLYIHYNKPPQIVLVELYQNIVEENASNKGRARFLPFYNSGIIDDYYDYCDDKSYFDIPLYRYVFYPPIGWREHFKILFKNRNIYFKEGLMGYAPLMYQYKKNSHTIIKQDKIKISSHIAEIIKVCNQNNIKAVFFTSPILGEKNEKVIIKMENIFKNYLNQSNLLSNSQFFKDDTHVNHYGAKKQTYNMSKYLLKLLN